MFVVTAEHPVVERLRVVGIGAGLDQVLRQFIAVPVGRAPCRAIFPLAEYTGQDGVRTREAGPEIARVRVGAMGKQQSGRFDS